MLHHQYGMCWGCEVLIIPHSPLDLMLHLTSFSVWTHFAHSCTQNMKCFRTEVCDLGHLWSPKHRGLWLSCSIKHSLPHENGNMLLRCHLLPLPRIYLWMRWLVFTFVPSLFFFFSYSAHSLAVFLRHTHLRLSLTFPELSREHDSSQGPSPQTVTVDQSIMTGGKVKQTNMTAVMKSDNGQRTVRMSLTCPDFWRRSATDHRDTKGSIARRSPTAFRPVLETVKINSVGGTSPEGSMFYLN